MIKNRCSPVSLVLFSAIGAFLICAVSAQAQFEPFPDDCVVEAGGLNRKAVCTANDVSLTALKPRSLIIIDECDGLADAGCPLLAGNAVPGGADCVTFSAIGLFELTTQTRYDIGLYIATDGDTSGNGAKNGECTRFAFDPESVGASESDGDTCGDIEQNATHDAEFQGFFGPVTVPCLPNAEGLVDVFHCETWGQQAGDIACTGSEDVVAGTTSKCNCGILPGICIPAGASGTGECGRNICALRCSNSLATTCDEDTDCPAGGVCQERRVTEFEPSTTVCRASADCCDVAESCTGDSIDCPTDEFQPATTTCRPVNGKCDLSESCTGNSADCPADVCNVTPNPADACSAPAP